MKKGLLVSALVLTILLTGCGVAGYDTVIEAEYNTEELIVTLEKKGASLEDKQGGLEIHIINDPNGLLALFYKAESREAVGGSHDPAATAQAFAEIVKAFPTDFWVEIAKAAKEVFDKQSTDPNE